MTVCTVFGFFGRRSHHIPNQLVEGFRMDYSSWWKIYGFIHSGPASEEASRAATVSERECILLSNWVEFAARGGLSCSIVGFMIRLFVCIDWVVWQIQWMNAPRVENGSLKWPERRFNDGRQLSQMWEGIQVSRFTTTLFFNKFIIKINFSDELWRS